MDCVRKRSGTEFVCAVTEQEAQGRLRVMTPEQLGRFGEVIWQNVLATSGWKYIPLCSIADGGAPMARTDDDATILPDIQCWKDGKSVFVEAKAKTRSVYYGRKSQERHGIDENNYEHYIKAAISSSIPCFLAIVECWSEPHRNADLRWSGTLLIESLHNLGYAEPSEFREEPPKVYWNRKHFSDIHSMSAIQLFELANKRKRLCCKHELDRIFDPWKQRGLFE